MINTSSLYLLKNVREIINKWFSADVTAATSDFSDLYIKHPDNPQQAVIGTLFHFNSPSNALHILDLLVLGILEHLLFLLDDDATYWFTQAFLNYCSASILFLITRARFLWSFYLCYGHRSLYVGDLQKGSNLPFSFFSPLIPLV